MKNKQPVIKLIITINNYLRIMISRKYIPAIVRILILFATILITFEKSDNSTYESAIINYDLNDKHYNTTCYGSSYCSFALCSIYMNPTNYYLNYYPVDRCSHTDPQSCQSGNIAGAGFVFLSIIICFCLIYIVSEHFTDVITKIFKMYGTYAILAYNIFVTLFYSVLTAILIGLSLDSEWLQWDCHIMGYGSIIFVFVHLTLGIYHYVNNNDHHESTMYTGFFFLLTNICLIISIASLINAPTNATFATPPVSGDWMLMTTHDYQRNTHMYTCNSTDNCNELRCALSAPKNVDYIALETEWIDISCNVHCSSSIYAKISYVNLIPLIFAAFCVLSAKIKDRKMAAYISGISLAIYVLSSIIISIAAFLLTTNLQTQCELNVIITLCSLLIAQFLLVLDYYISCTEDDTITNRLLESTN